MSSTWSIAPTPSSSDNETLGGAMVTSPSSSPSWARTPRLPSAHAVTVPHPSGPLPVTSLNVSSWRPSYPAISHFAMTDSQEVFAVGPEGLFSFKRVNDHPSRPWSKPHIFPLVSFDTSSVSGIALHEDKSNKRLDVFCAANGSLYNVTRTTKFVDGKPVHSFESGMFPPLATYGVNGTPSLSFIGEDPHRGYSGRLALVVPSLFGGLLHTCTVRPNNQDYDFLDEIARKWEPVSHVATSLGMVSAVTIAPLTFHGQSGFPGCVEILAVCIAHNRLYSVKGSHYKLINKGSHPSSPDEWEGEIPERIHHPGEVKGTPVLLQRKVMKNHLDLLVPSAAGGIFHYVQTPSTPDEWHMIARIGFPIDLPPAGSLAFYVSDEAYTSRSLGAVFEIGGRLYNIESKEGQTWSDSKLCQVTGPGPSHY
ncbi:unnamed protein product [Clonostachys rosea]|uniref:Uncharacterized protein n=1 Tax=Bionectria ochroleuca TaxID=29856 RepID=A0ABY6TVH5_BIOOC|nr:unnamed protein product [Clonostachys rosea]